jgi:hypothetical protein
MPTGNAAQGIYEVVDGKHYGADCCWEFGNASTDNCSHGAGPTDALFFGNDYWAKGAGAGPWFWGNFGRELWPDDPFGMCVELGNCVVNPSMNTDYVFGVLKASQSSGALRVGSTQAGGLTTVYNGSTERAPQLHGGIILGISEDNSNSSEGTFYEGAITSGRPSDATDVAVFANVQAAKYGR